MELIQSLNLGVRFLLELGALVAFGYWGNQSGQGPLRFALAIGLSIMAAIVWDGQLGPLDRAPLRLAVVHWIRKC